MVKYKENSEILNQAFSALANPIRREIIIALMNGEASVIQLAKPFQMSLPGISKHLKVLEKAGLIERSKKAQWRPCKINTKPLEEVNHWLDRCRKIWESRFDQLDKYLQEISKKKSNKNSK